MFKDLVYLDVWTQVMILINFFILMLVLKHFLYKPVKKILQKREDEVKELYKQAEDEKAQGVGFKTQYEEKMSNSEKEVAKLLENASKRASEKYDEMMEETKNKATHMINKANESIEQEKKLARNELKNEVSTLAVLAAKQVIEKEIDQQKHERLIEDFIENVGDSVWQK